MKTNMKFKRVVFGLVAVGALALSANAQAASFDAGVFAVGNGDAANPIVINFADPGAPGVQIGIFQDTVNFDLGSFTHFNMTSTVNNIDPFASSIFQNVDDHEINEPLPGNSNFPISGYDGPSSFFTSLALPNLGEPLDYHLHPSGVQQTGGGSYTLTLWGSNDVAPVPVPAAVYLFGSGLIGLVGLARRKMKAAA